VKKKCKKKRKEKGKKVLEKEDNGKTLETMAVGK